MTREEALVKIGSAVTLINDVAENFTDEIGRMHVPEDAIHATPMEKMIRMGSKILTDAIKFLQCEDEHEYLIKAVNMMIGAMSEQKRGDKDGGNNDDIEMPF